MELNHFAIEQVNESHLAQLVTIPVPESRTLDFKRDLIGRKDEDVREFLKDVVALANTVGGHLIYGIEEDSGIPKKLEGLKIPDPDAELLRLEQLLKTGIEPMIPGARIRIVPVQSERSAIVVRVPQSWIAPHRTNFKNSKRFYRRHSNGTYEPDVLELRDMFLAANTTDQRIKQFRSERVMGIKQGDTPVPFIGRAATICHVLPMGALSANQQIDIRSAFKLRDSFITELTGSGSRRYTFDGVVFHEVPGPGGNADEYTLVYRNGIVECARANMSFESEGQTYFKGRAAEAFVLKSLPSFLSGLASLGVNPPFAVLLSILRVQNTAMQPSSRGYDDRRSAHCSVEDLLLPPTVLDTAMLEGKWHGVLKPALDVMWNAFGFPASEQFDGQGEWTPAK